MGQAAVENRLIRRTPCFIREAGREDPDDRPVATVEQVCALAEASGIRRQLTVVLGVLATVRREEPAGLPCDDQGDRRAA